MRRVTGEGCNPSRLSFQISRQDGRTRQLRPCSTARRAVTQAKKLVRNEAQGLHLEAAGALDVHEEAVGLLNKTLKLVELALVGGRGVKEIVIDL